MSTSPPFDTNSLDALLAQVCRLHHTRAHLLLEEIGLYRGQPPVLFHLYHQDGLTHTELVNRLEVTPATITKSVQRLERAGFVTRVSDTEDQRVMRVYLTEAGRAIQRDMLACLRRLEEETFAGFDSEDRDLMRRLLTRTRANLMRAVRRPMSTDNENDEPEIAGTHTA